MLDSYITKVLFVKSEDNEITAVFPYKVGTNDPDTMMCYAHFGQHGACSEEWVRDCLKENGKVSEKEYSDLFKELFSIEYRLQVLKNFEWMGSWEYRNELLKGE
jgi:hypothetical protein